MTSNYEATKETGPSIINSAKNFITNVIGFSYYLPTHLRKKDDGTIYEGSVFKKPYPLDSLNPGIPSVSAAGSVIGITVTTTLCYLLTDATIPESGEIPLPAIAMLPILTNTASGIYEYIRKIKDKGPPKHVVEAERIIQEVRERAEEASKYVHTVSLEELAASKGMEPSDFVIERSLQSASPLLSDLAYAKDRVVVDLHNQMKSHGLDFIVGARFEHSTQTGLPRTYLALAYGEGVKLKESSN